MADDPMKRIAQRYGGTFAGSGVGTTVSNPNVQQTPYKPINQQNQNLLQKAGAVASQTFHIAEQGVEAAGKYIAHAPKDFYDTVSPGLRPLAAVLTGSYKHELGGIEKQQSQLDLNMKSYDDLYKSGKISKDKYAELMRDASKSFTELGKQATDIQKRAYAEGNPEEVIKQSAIIAATILSGGRYRPIGASAKLAGAGFVVRAEQKGLDTVLGKATQKLENAMTNIPAVRDLVARNTGSFLAQDVKQMMGETAGQFISRNTKDLAIGMLLKRPIVYETNIGLSEDVYNHILDGQYDQAIKSAAWIGAQMVSGGPLGWFFRNGKRLGNVTRKLAHGKGSFIDELSKRIGTGSPAQLAILARDNKDIEKTLRIAQEVNLRQADDSVDAAVASVLNHYEQHGIDTKTLSPEDLVHDLTRWADADEIARAVSPAGEDVKYVAVRWDTAAKNALADAVEKAGDDLQAMNNVVQEMGARPGVGWGNNNILMAKLGQAISTSTTSQDAAAAIRAINTASTIAKDIPAAKANRLAKLGYSLAEPFGGRKTPAVDYSDTRKLVSQIAKGDDEIFDESLAPHPSVESLAYGLKKFGLSPESNTNVAFEKLTESLVLNLENLNATHPLGLDTGDASKGGRFILSRLQDYVTKQGPSPYLNVLVAGRSQQSALQDIRQMNVKEMMEALPGISRETAKQLQKAVMKAYTDVPLEFRGLGVKAFDYGYRVPGAKAYFRIQSALRYTYNPFFRAQEVLETKTLSHMKANNLVWMQPRKELDRVSKVLDDSKIFTSGYTGESTQDLTLGRLQANLLKTQKRDLAGLSIDLANKRGITVEQMVQDHPDELADALRVIVQYPTKGVLNSPLARTLNVAFFPMRYNLKVAGIVAREVAKLPPTVQTAFIHSVFKASDWLKSDEGIKWQTENADAIQLFSYFSVYSNITSVTQRLRGTKPNSIGELGLLGGLPFGFISQLLDNEGLIHLNTPYVNPKTGNVMPDYVPETTKARAAVAIESMLNTMFTYPGRIIGLPGKEATIRKATGVFIDTNGSDFEKVSREAELTPLQRKWVEVLNNPNVTQDQIDELYTTPAPDMFNWYTLPPSLPASVTPLTKSEVLAMKTKASGAAAKGPKAKKKALPIPGQGQSLSL